VQASEASSDQSEIDLLSNAESRAILRNAAPFGLGSLAITFGEL